MADAMSDPGQGVENPGVYDGRNMNLAGPVPNVNLSAEEWLRLARQEVVRFQLEAAKYADLHLLNSLSKDWKVLAADLESGDHVKIVAACREYTAYGHKAVEPLLRLVGHTSDVRCRALALDLLKRFISEKEIEVRLMNAMLNTQAPDEKINLLAGLAEFATQETGPKVEGLVQHQDGTIRRAAYDVLAKIGMGIFTQALFQALEDDVDEIKADAIRAVGQEKLAMGVPPLLKFIPITTVFQQEKYERVQALACQALGQVADQRATNRLLGVLARQSVPNRTKRPEVRAAAAMALINLVNFDTKERIVAALQKASKDSNLLVSNAAKVALKRVGEWRMSDRATDDSASTLATPSAVEQEEESVF